MVEIPSNWFDNNFINSLPEDVSTKLAAMCSRFFDFHYAIKGGRPGQMRYYYPGYVGCFAFLQGFYEYNKDELSSLRIKIDFPIFSSPSDPQSNINVIVNLFEKTKDQVYQKGSETMVKAYKEQYKAKLIPFPFYELSDADYNGLQTLINQLRDAISESKYIKDEHKTRLLQRLEQLQTELHKKMSNFDRFWGTAVEISGYLSTIGKNVKPIIDIIREIMKIVWTSQGQNLGLPSPPDLPLELPALIKESKRKKKK